MDWNAAKYACEAQGSNLVVLDSNAKLRDVPSSAAAAYKDDYLWIGLHRDPKYNARWLWVGGLQVTFDTWGDLQPNSQQGGEDCGVLRRSSKKWHDFSCMERFGYICEINGKYNLFDKKAV